MKDLIKQDNMHLLWKGERGDTFLILKYAEIFRYSENVLRVLIFSPKMVSPVKKLGSILEESVLDDGIYSIDINKSKLPLLIQLGAFKKRPHLNGRWIKDKEKRLGHEILPFRPRLDDIELLDSKQPAIPVAEVKIPELSV